MAKKKLDVILIGGGHNGLVAAAYLAKAGQQVLVLERDEQVGGILRAEPARARIHGPWARPDRRASAGSVVKDLKLERYGYATVTPAVRMHAPMPDGSAVTFWADAAKTADGIKARNPKDAQAYLDFDKKVRSIASFLAYIAVATPPDPKSPVACRRDHGAEAREGVPRPRRQDRPRGRASAADGGGRPRAGGIRG